jgi:hypothetical protein
MITQDLTLDKNLLFSILLKKNSKKELHFIKNIMRKFFFKIRFTFF